MTFYWLEILANLLLFRERWSAYQESRWLLGYCGSLLNRNK